MYQSLLFDTKSEEIRTINKSMWMWSILINNYPCTSLKGFTIHRDHIITLIDNNDRMHLLINSLVTQNDIK